MSLPEQLLSMRRSKNLTQRALADILGVRKITILRIENSQHMPKPTTRKLIESWIEQNQPRETLEF